MTWQPIEPIEGVNHPEGITPSLTGLSRGGPFIAWKGGYGYFHPNDPVPGRSCQFMLCRDDVAEAMAAFGFAEEGEVAEMRDRLADSEGRIRELEAALEEALEQKVVRYADVKKDLFDLHEARVGNKPPKQYVGRPRKTV